MSIYVYCIAIHTFVGLVYVIFESVSLSVANSFYVILSRFGFENMDMFYERRQVFTIVSFYRTIINYDVEYGSRLLEYVKKYAEC